MGRAVTALDGPESAFWNPAGLTGVSRHSAVFFRGGQSIGGETTAFSLVLPKAGVGAMGMSYLLHDLGDQELTDANGNYRGTISVRNHVGAMSLAGAVMASLSAGMNLKMVRSRYDCRGNCDNPGTTATTYALDAGLQLRPAPDRPLKLGFMVAHLGPALQVQDIAQADPIPGRIRLAASYDVLTLIDDNPLFQGWLSFEVQQRLRDRGPTAFYFGSEFRAGEADGEDMLMLRAGAVLHGDVGQASGNVGLGIRYERFELSVARGWVVSGLEESPPIHVTLALTF